MISPKNAILQWEHDIFHVQIIWHYAYKGTNDILCKWDRGLALFSDKTLQSYFCLTIFCSFYVIIFISFFQDFLDICFFRILVLYQDFPHMFFICNIFFLVQNFLHICFCFFYVLFLAQNFLHICFCHILFFAQNFSFFFFFFLIFSFWSRISLMFVLSYSLFGSGFSPYLFFYIFSSLFGVFCIFTSFHILFLVQDFPDISFLNILFLIQEYSDNLILTLSSWLWISIIHTRYAPAVISLILLLANSEFIYEFSNKKLLW